MFVANQVEKQPQEKASSPLSPQESRKCLRTMMLIRRFEERTYQEYTRPGQRIGGFCHLYSGQEAVAAGIAVVFQKSKDYLINGYRDHGHSLALGMEPRVAMAEMFGRATGCSKGKGGSMHFFQAEAGNLGGHGIVGGHIPLGAGAAFACKYKQTGGVCFTLFGDGALNQGAFAESMNLAGLWKLPCIFIVENNGVAMGTQVARSSAEKDLANRGSGFGMPHRNVDGNDLEAVVAAAGEAAARGRAGEGPSFLAMSTYRFRGHSMSDPQKYRTKEDLERARQRDPIAMWEKKLRARGIIDDASVHQIEQEVNDIVNDAVKFADSSPHPDPGELYTDVLAEKYPLQK
jgi:pyruvate dehydrogenase E1 component alpha subunit